MEDRRLRNIMLWIFLVIYMLYYSIKRNQFNIHKEKLKLKYGETIIESIRWLDFIQDLIICVLIGLITSLFSRVLNRYISGVLVYQGRSLGEALKFNFPFLLLYIIGALIILFKYIKVSQTIDGESLEKDEKNMLKDYLVIKRFSVLIKIIFLAFLDILFSYLA